MTPQSVLLPMLLAVPEFARLGPLLRSRVLRHCINEVLSHLMCFWSGGEIELFLQIVVGRRVCSHWTQWQRFLRTRPMVSRRRTHRTGIPPWLPDRGTSPVWFLFLMRHWRLNGAATRRWPCRPGRSAGAPWRSLSSVPGHPAPRPVRCAPRVLESAQAVAEGPTPSRGASSDSPAPP